MDNTEIIRTTPDYRTSRDLFSNYYLDERLPGTAAWATDESAVRSAYDELRARYRDRDGPAADGGERRLPQTLLEPAFETLGFESAAVDGGDRHDTGHRRWLRPDLDVTGPDWRVFTDGRKWRLYCDRTGHRPDAYYEINLPTLLETGDPEEFKYFYLFFRREAFLDGDPPFVERVRRGSDAVADELAADLRESAPEALSVLARGFAESADDFGRENLDAAYDGALTYLYRLLVVLYAESEGRNLLDASDETYRQRYSLTALKRRVAAELDGPDPDFRADRTALWNRLDDVFALLDEGSRAPGVRADGRSVPTYDGGLFGTDPESGETAAFLDAHPVRDEYLARAIDLLARRGSDEERGGEDAEDDDEQDRDDGSDSEDEGGDGCDRRAFVDYSSLDVRHLGRIHEELLEYDLEVADGADGTGAGVEPGDVTLAADGDERKRTGSYYTPKFVVEYVVEQALDPLLDEVRADLDPADPDYPESFAERVFDLSVLDPAMGSGHFLVEAVEYLAGAVAAARREHADHAGRETTAGDDPTNVADTSDVHRARRQVARRCVYGVDSDATAVELAKASLWLRTLAGGRPLSVPDHHLERGDALAGTGVAGIAGAECADAEREDAGTRFDAVVGNPPYVRSRNLPPDLKDRYREEFETARGAYDLYVPFAELAGDLARRVSLVVPNKWTTTDYGRALRDRLLDEDGLREVLDASNLDVFPDADIYPVVVTYGESASDGDGSDRIRIRHPEGGQSLSDAPTTTVPESLVDRLGGRVIPLDLDPEFVGVAADVLDRCDRLGDHATMTEGVHTGNVRGKLVVEAETEGVDDGTLRRLVDGKSVDRYRLDWDGRWLRYDESLVGPGEYADLRTPDCFEGEKLLVRDISDRPVAVHDDADHYALNTLYSVRSREDSSLPLRYLLGVFNSAFAATYFRQVYGGTHVRGGYLRFKPMFAERIPVPDPDAAPVGPDGVAEAAADAGIEAENLPDDPESAVATLTERVRAARDRRAELDLDAKDHFGSAPGAGDFAGETLGDVGVRADGVGDSVLAEAAADRDGLRVGEVRVSEGRVGEGGFIEPRIERGASDGTGPLVLSATARYRPADGERADRETDPWGYVETEPIPALRFPALGQPERTLVGTFVPRAVEQGDGFAGFRANATRNNSLLDRLRALTLPDAGRATDDVARYLETCAAAEELDRRISALEDALDGVVYRLYGVDPEDVEAIW